jgi:hypothetical protein
MVQYIGIFWQAALYVCVSVCVCAIEIDPFN